MMQKNIASKNAAFASISILAAILFLFALLVDAHPVFSAARGQTREFATGDVLISVGKSRVFEWRDPNGILIKILDTKEGAPTGLAFNLTDKNLYVTNFEGNSVSTFNSTGDLIGHFGSGYRAQPESILFDQSENVYVGQADGQTLLKFDRDGKLIKEYSVEVEDRGSDWIDLAADQCTMYYTSEGHSVKRYDVCANQQLPDFSTGLPGQTAYALRLLPGGGLLVADYDNILRLDSTGKIIQQYGEPGQKDWFALNLDPDGKSFWSADFSAIVYKFDIASGKQLLTIDTASEGVSGLAIVGEITVAQPTPALTPPINPLPNDSSNTWLIGGLVAGGILCLCGIGIIIIIAIAGFARSARR